jgi:hypothetical protein
LRGIAGRKFLQNGNRAREFVAAQAFAPDKFYD